MPEIPRIYYDPVENEIYEHTDNDMWFNLCDGTLYGTHTRKLEFVRLVPEG